MAPLAAEFKPSLALRLDYFFPRSPSGNALVPSKMEIYDLDWRSEDSVKASRLSERRKRLLRPRRGTKRKVISEVAETEGGELAIMAKSVVNTKSTKLLSLERLYPEILLCILTHVCPPLQPLSAPHAL
jgi:hypothetical protein